jgi:hypothetical protein
MPRETSTIPTKAPKRKETQHNDVKGPEGVGHCGVHSHQEHEEGSGNPRDDHGSGGEHSCDENQAGGGQTKFCDRTAQFWFGGQAHGDEEPEGKDKGNDIAAFKGIGEGFFGQVWDRT